MRHFPSFLLAFPLCVACITTRLAPLRTAQPLEDDERQMFHEADEQDARFARLGALYGDAALDAWLDGVALRLAQASGLQFRFHVRALRSPYVNAFTLPNGSIYVHLGVLARMDNEAQLATLLAHEMTHATHRHAVRERRDLQNKFDAAAVLLPGLGSLAAAASVSGYSRELETEADEAGFALVAAAGYDLGETPKLFEKLEQELRDEKQEEPFFFATHPALAARIANYRRLQQSAHPKPSTAPPAGEFLSRTREVVYVSALLDLQRSRWPQVLREAEKCKQLDPASARPAFLRGEVLRQKADAPGAIEEYRRAVTLDASFAEAWRPLGILLLKRGDKAPAREALQRYLELAPLAKDRGYVEHDLAALQ